MLYVLCYCWEMRRIRKRTKVEGARYWSNKKETSFDHFTWNLFLTFALFWNLSRQSQRSMCIVIIYELPVLLSQEKFHDSFDYSFKCVVCVNDRILVVYYIANARRERLALVSSIILGFIFVIDEYS